ncbi:Uncharacterised protein [Bordetella pertussis]|nr:Uncharacterised protein [Bordetella pertussis]
MAQRGGERATDQAYAGHSQHGDQGPLPVCRIVRAHTCRKTIWQRRTDTRSVTAAAWCASTTPWPYCAGYEPSTLKKATCACNAASARATFASSRWPSTST